jgi:hypothetical protein
MDIRTGYSRRQETLQPALAALRWLLLTLSRLIEVDPAVKACDRKRFELQ